jgi:hypothetical protein
MGDVDCLLSTCRIASHISLYFDLSHPLVAVAPACFNEENPPIKSLEEYIVLQAAGYGFQLETILRPNDISSSAVQEPASRRNVLNNISLHEMQEVGAAVLVFQRS